MNENWRQLLSLIPQAQGQPIDWPALEGTPLSPCISRMAATPQEPAFHGEGDVWTHTRMVCEQLLTLGGYWQLTPEARTALFMAALLHDIGKPQTTRLENGVLRSPHHGPVGAQLARRLLWTTFDLAGTQQAQQLREAICLLIRYHTAPPNVMSRTDPAYTVRRLAAAGCLAPHFTLNALCLLAEADVLGRIADDTQDMLDMVRLCAEQADESGCLHSPYAFPDAYTAHAYLAGREVPPDVPLYDDTWGEVIMLCGLPGTGKDTYISAHCAGLPMLSLDNIRRMRGVKPTDDQGRVIQEGREQARRLLAAHQPFVFNGTNLTDMMRGKWAQLFEQYHARVHMVFLETSWQENLRRNRSRAHVVPEAVIDALLDKLTPPEAHEAQTVSWLTL